MVAKPRMVWLTLLAVVATGLVVGQSPRASAQSDEVFKLTRVQVNRLNFPDEVGQVVSVGDSKWEVSYLEVPTAVGKVNWQPMPETLVPGESMSVDLHNTIDYTGGREEGFHQMEVFIWVNNHKPTERLTGTIGCSDSFPRDRCLDSVDSTVSIPYVVPSDRDKVTILISDRFCDSCAITYFYERTTEVPGPRVLPRMSDRYGKKDSDGVVRPTRRLVPREFKVAVKLKRADGTRCKRGDKTTAVVEGAKSIRRKNRCAYDLTFFDEGTYKAKFTLSSGGEVGTTSTEVVVQDWLIIGIGDSNGSGEGTPDIPRSGTTAAVWVDQRCDRSGNSHQARSARLLEKTSKSTAVTFVHLACSGAEIDTGLLKGYEGIIAAKPNLAPQMRKVKRIAKKREVDALLVSIGVNDLKFGAMVAKCIDQVACWTRADVAGGSGATLDDGMKKRLAELPRLYARLAKKIDRAGIEPDRVYITQYFDSTKDQNGTTCNPLIRVGAGSLSVDFDQAEAQWAHDSVLAPLNAAVQAAAEKHGWNLVGGSPELFAEHGYCSNDSWIVSLTQSVSRQGDQNGTLHSTRKGNDAQAGLMVPIVRSDFFAQQKIRSPREP